MLVATSAMPATREASDQLAVHLLQLGFRLLDGGEVLGDAHRADDLAVIVAQGHFGGDAPGVLALFPSLLLNLADDGLAGADDVLLVGEGILGVLVAEEIEVGFSDNILGGAAEAFVQPPAGADKPRVEVLEVNEVPGTVHERVEEASFAAQFGLLPGFLFQMPQAGGNILRQILQHGNLLPAKKIRLCGIKAQNARHSVTAQDRKSRRRAYPGHCGQLGRWEGLALGGIVIPHHRFRPAQCGLGRTGAVGSIAGQQLDLLQAMAGRSAPQIGTRAPVCSSRRPIQASTKPPSLTSRRQISGRNLLPGGR